MKKCYLFVCLLFVFGFLFMPSVHAQVDYDTDGTPIYSNVNYISPIDQQIGQYYTAVSYGNGNTGYYTVGSGSTDVSSLKFLTFGILNNDIDKFVYSVDYYDNSSTPESRWIYSPYRVNFCSQRGPSDFEFSTTKGTVDALKLKNFTERNNIGSYTGVVSGLAGFLNLGLSGGVSYKAAVDVVNYSSDPVSIAMNYTDSDGNIVTQYITPSIVDNYTNYRQFALSNDSVASFYLYGSGNAHVSITVFTENNYPYCYEAIGLVRLRTACWDSTSYTGYDCSLAKYFATDTSNDFTKFNYKNLHSTNVNFYYESFELINVESYASLVNNCVDCIYHTNVADITANAYFSDQITQFFSSFNSFITGDSPITNIMLRPVSYIESVTGTCSTITLSYRGTSIPLKCGTDIFWNRSDVTTFKHFWNTLFGGAIIYGLCRLMYKNIKKILSPYGVVGGE